MSSSYFATPLIFVIDILFHLYIIVVAIRIIMQKAGWDYYNPLSQMVIKATQPPVKFLRRFIPSIGSWDTATIVLLIAVTLLKLILVTLIMGAPLDPLKIMRLTAADIFSLFIIIYTVSIIIEVLLSWLTPAGSYNPIAPLITKMNAPLLKPVRRLLPSFGGLDLSPLFVLIGLQVLSMLVMPILTGALIAGTLR